MMKWTEEMPPLLRDGFILSLLGHVLLFFIIMAATNIKIAPNMPEIIQVSLVDMPLNTPLSKKSNVPTPPKPSPAAAAATPKEAPKPTPAPAPEPAKPEPAPAQVEKADGAVETATPTPERQAAAKPEAAPAVPARPDEAPPAPTRPVKPEAVAPVRHRSNERPNIEDLTAAVEELRKEGAVERGENLAPQPIAPVENTRLSLAYIDAIRAKLRGCWNIDAGAKGIENMQIIIRMNLAADGTIISTEMLNESNLPSEIAMATSARRALHTCAPYDNLPLDAYNDWKTITFTFYPGRGMVN